MTNGDLNAFIKADPPQMHLQLKDFLKIRSTVQLICRNTSRPTGSFCEGQRTTAGAICNRNRPQFLISASRGAVVSVLKSPSNFMKLESDGRLKIYDWNADGKEWVPSEFRNKGSDECLYPLRCGPFGLCRDGQCNCPLSPDRKSQFFKYVNDELPDSGCEEISSASCNDTNSVSLVNFGNYSYFGYVDSTAAAGNINNCSCKAMFFNSQNNVSRGSCYMLNQVFSIRAEPLYGQTYISWAFIKVSNLSISQSQSEGGQEDRKKKIATSTIGIAVGSSAVAILFAGTIVFLIIRKRGEEEDQEEDELDQAPGMMPRRFSYEDLKTATGDFHMIIGRGGFGSVFSGSLVDGTRLAVKRLDNMGQGMKEFVAGVQTIGSIHHVNLVRLIGFCARKSSRLLVYEYMPNGSLDKWIFHENENLNLDWKTRQNIIIGTAKGLSYLHEECSQRIVHLDIKPQNILLDENFNAKLSDFGLSKLISRDESQVVTTMRGTPGYLAPEWLSASISEKAGVYSFGVMVMEVVCGRRNFDPSRPEPNRHLLKLLQYIPEENQLLDFVDITNEERSRCGEEALRVIRIAMWCLQNEYTKRPSMSFVVKVLEGSVELDGCTDFGSFHAMASQSGSEMQSGSDMQSGSMQDFSLSGPR